MNVDDPRLFRNKDDAVLIRSQAVTIERLRTALEIANMDRVRLQRRVAALSMEVQKAASERDFLGNHLRATGRLL